MYPILQTLMFFIFFLVISFVVIYIPGSWIILKNKRQLEDQEIITLSLALGVIVFVLTAVILAILHLRFLFLPLLLIVSLIVIFKYKFKILKPWNIFIKNAILSLLLIAGILTQGFINFPSGYLYNNGLDFWSSQGHDGIWHIALMEEIKKGIPPQNPIFAGERAYNYHYLVDILMGEYSRIFPFFSTLDLYFRFFPVIFSFLIGISVFALIKRWRQNAMIGYLAVLFTYFVGSFGYVVTFMRNGTIFGGETVFWAAQQNTLLGNPPHAISHGLLAAFFLAILIYLAERRKFWLVVAFVLAATLAGFKVSGGFVMLAGIGVAAVIDFLFYKKKGLVVLALSLGLSNFVTFKAMTSSEAASFLMFLPWWFIRTMVVDKLGWMDLELRREYYVAQGTWHAWLRVFQLEATAFIIFLVGNSGMRILGFYTLIKNILNKAFYKNQFEVMLVVTMITGFLMPIFFVQKGIIYNNIQFMQYFLFILGFYGAITVYHAVNLFKNNLIKGLILVIVAALSVPTVIGNLNEFYGPHKTALAIISNRDLEALQYLKDHTNQQAIILTMPFNKYLKDKFPYQPRPIYAWYSTAYIPALTGRRIYLADEEQALITGYPIEERLSKEKIFFEQKDPIFNKKFLKDERINYIYIAKNEIEKPLDITTNGLSIFFENNEVIIYKVENS